MPEREGREVGRAQLNQLVLHFDYMCITTRREGKRKIEDEHMSSRYAVE